MSSARAVWRSVTPVMRGLAVAVGLLAARPSGRLVAQSFEQRLLAIPDTASVRQMSRTLSAVPHMAGTPAQAATRDYALERLRVKLG
mgnify:CR=1 FL=1